MAEGKHRADSGKGFSVWGRENRGVPEGEQNPSRTEDQQQFDQALADQRARDYQARHAADER